MNIIKLHSTAVCDENGDLHTLILKLTEKDGIYGFECSLVPAAQYAKDHNITNSKSAALDIFDILCKEKVLPLNFYAVLDDMSDLYTT